MNNYQSELLKQLTRIADALERRNKKREPKPISIDPIVTEFLDEVPINVQQGWVELFKDKIWIEAELKKAAIWCQTNPWKRLPGDTNARFALSWLQRAQEKLKEKKTPASTPKAEKPVAPVLEHEVVDNPDGTTSVVIRALS